MPGKDFSTINKWLDREGSTSQSQQQCMKTPCPKSSSILDIEFDRFGNTSLVLRKLISLKSLHPNSVLKHREVYALVLKEFTEYGPGFSWLYHLLPCCLALEELLTLFALTLPASREDEYLD